MAAPVVAFEGDLGSNFKLGATLVETILSLFSIFSKKKFQLFNNQKCNNLPKSLSTGLVLVPHCFICFSSAHVKEIKITI